MATHSSELPNKKSKVSGFISLRKERGASAYIIPTVDDPSLNRIRGAKIRSSTRWIDSEKAKETLAFPYLDSLGRFTGSTLFEWNCDPRSYIASVISTVAHRLRRHCFKHNRPHLVVRNSDRIIRVAYYYAITKNSYFWDRVLFFTRNLEKYGTLLHRLFVKLVNKTDAHKRFVYGHVCSQTKWLLFRAKRPRDKSATHNGVPASKRYISLGCGALYMKPILKEMAHAISFI